MNNRLIIAKLGSVYGVRGWLKVHSYMEPASNILEFTQLQVHHRGQWQIMAIDGVKPHGNGFIIKFTDITDREVARQYTNDEIAIFREELPELDDDTYYWADLIGCRVVNLNGVEFGTVMDLLETGANDVLIVKNDERERWIPYTDDAVKTIDIAAKHITVDWDPEF